MFFCTNREQMDWEITHLVTEMYLEIQELEIVTKNGDVTNVLMTTIQTSRCAKCVIIIATGMLLLQVRKQDSITITGGTNRQVRAARATADDTTTVFGILRQVGLVFLGAGAAWQFRHSPSTFPRPVPRILPPIPR